MAKEKTVEFQECVLDTTSSYCSIESVMTIDERGQIVLPKDIRTRAGLGPGDKVALISWEKEGKICCFSMVPVRELSGSVAKAIRPMMNSGG